MTIKSKLSALLLPILLFLSIPACKRLRAHQSLEAIDQIDRRANVPMTQPTVARDLSQIRERGTLVVLAPYNSTTYFIYRGEPLGYEYELLQAFARDMGVGLKMIVVTDRKSLLPLLNSGEGDLVASRLVPTPEDEAHVAFTRALYRTEPALVQQEASPDKAGSGTEKALAPGPANPLPEVDIQARLVSQPAQLAGETVYLPEKSAYRRTLVELADEVSGDIHVIETSGEMQDEALAQ